jgi:hypothetical protein
MMRFQVTLILLAIAAGVVMQASLGSDLVTAQSDATMAIDANPDTPEVDAVSPPVTGGASAIVSVNIEAASEPYHTYQWEISYDAAELDLVTSTHLSPSGLTACGAFTKGTFRSGSLMGQAFVNTACGTTAATSFTGQVDLLGFQCVSVGTHKLHLVTTAEDDVFGGAVVGFSTELIDAQVTCQEAVGPAPTGTPPEGATPGSTPVVTAATPTPLPPGYEAIALVEGCQFEAWTGGDGTMPGELAGLVDPGGNLVSLWAQQPAPVWRGYSPQFPEVSDLGPVNLLDVVAICATGPAVFVRPIV